MNQADDQDQADARGVLRIPLVVIGGFLGAGKSTLLNHWLTNANGQRLAVLVNDFGQIDVDAAMVAAHDGETLSLANGCICCSLSSGLEQALMRVIERQPPVDLILIEASGVSDPGRIAQVGLVDPKLQLEAVVVLVDAEHLIEQLDDALLADTLRRQIVAASLVVLNKKDLVSRERLAAVRQRLVRQFDRVPVLEAAHGALPLAPLVFRSPAGRAQTESMASSPGPRGFRPGSPGEETLCRASEHERLAAPGHPFEGGVWRSHGVLDADVLIGALKRLPRTVMRVKGWVTTDRHGRALIQLAGGRVRIDPLGAASGSPTPDFLDDNALVYIGLRDSDVHGTMHAALPNPLMHAWRQAGYETRIRRVEPDVERPLHAHPFDVRILVLQGELILERAGGAQAYRAGEGFDLPAGCQHAERYGPTGATVLSGRRHRPNR